jgi:phosphate transport system permease protein
MQLATRKALDRAFTGLGVFSVALMAASLVVLLAPIVWRGAGAFVFRGTVEYRRAMLDQFGRGDREAIAREAAPANADRQWAYDMLGRFEDDLARGDSAMRAKYRLPLQDLKARLRVLLGPLPGEQPGALMRGRYGQTRWDRALVKLHDVLYATQYDYSDPSQMGRKVLVPRAERFRGTSIEPLFARLPSELPKMLRPRLTFYWRFLFDGSFDAQFFGGIWPAVLGTLYLTLGAMLIAGPVGIICATYLAEFAGHTWFVSLIRTCISTLAGVPSIVFGLFGLAFFINTLHVSPSKSVFAGALTLAVLVLPTVIRASEEAIHAVPQTYREAALSLGAGRLRTTFTVVLPAALPGVLTSIIISMGRAAGETAPIIFTAAVSLGVAPKLWEVFTQPTPALPWSIYNLATEHEAVDEIRHVQYGMVLTLIVMVLLLNAAAIYLRARVSRRLQG